MEEHKEGVAVREEGHIRESLHDKPEDQSVEEGGDFPQLGYGELLLLLKQLVIIKDTAREHTQSTEFIWSDYMQRKGQGRGRC